MTQHAANYRKMARLLAACCYLSAAEVAALFDVETATADAMLARYWARRPAEAERERIRQENRRRGSWF